MNKFYMVKGSGPTNHRHATREAAEAEATRLAKANHGKEFAVLEATRSFCVPIVENVEIVDLQNPTPTPAPWYPDDSGEWIEWDGEHILPSPDTVVQVLLRYHRELKIKNYMAARPVGGWSWNRNNSRYSIVAYKVVD